jgi:hypothetical protein
MAYTFRVECDTDIGPSGTPSVLVIGAAVGTIIQSAYFTNVGTGEAFCNVQVNSTATARVSYKTSIPAGQTLILDKVIVLEPTDTLEADGTDLESVISVLDIT